MAMTNYIDFMRKVEGKPPRPAFDTSGFSYTGRMRVSPTHIRAALNGEHRRIEDAFSWNRTSIPDEWCDTIYSGVEPTPTQKAYLEWMIREYDDD
jgi:hypothetical protein